MNFQKTAFLLCAVALLAASCSKKPKAGYSTVKLNDFFELKMGNSALLPEAEMKLTLKAVPEDSRCPRFVNCIQEGQVKVGLIVAIDGKGQPVELVRKPSDKGPNTATVGAYKVQLYEVMPYPESGKKINPEEYSVRLSVRKTGENQEQKQ
jgi:hypothetical protein